MRRDVAEMLLKVFASVLLGVLVAAAFFTGVYLTESSGQNRAEALAATPIRAQTTAAEGMQTYLTVTSISAITALITFFTLFLHFRREHA